MTSSADEYRGMSQEAEDEYNKRQSEPLFKSAKDMIPMEQVKEIQSQLRCANAKRGCKFFAMRHWCLCCMMLKSIGSVFFEYEQALQRKDPEFIFSMTDWQKEQYDTNREYWIRWCDNYPRGATTP